MTTDYVEQYSAGGGTPIYGSGISATKPEPPSPLHWRTFKLPKDDPDAENWIGWEIKLEDTRGGYAQYGDFGRGSNQYDGDYRKTSISTLDQRFDDHLLLPPLITATAALHANLTNIIVSATHFGNTKQFVMGLRSSSARAEQLQIETSSVNPVLVAANAAYTPSGVNLVSLSPIVIGGAATVEKLMVGFTGFAAEVHTTAGTSDGSMHALTTAAWGNIRSPINAATPGTGTNLIYAGAGPAAIYTLAETAAIGTAPTAVLANLPSGGAGLGIEQLQKNYPLRVFWFMPIADVGNTMYTGNPITPARVMTTNLEGTDRQFIPSSIPYAYHACLWNQNIVQTDSIRVVAYDGEGERDLHFNRNRPANTNFAWRCVGLIPRGADLFAYVQRDDMTLAVGGQSSSLFRLTIEQYLPDFDSWVEVSGDFAPGATAVSVAANYSVGGPAMVTKANAAFHVVSLQTGFLHTPVINSTQDMRMFLSPGGVNPYYHYNLTGTTQYISQGWATTGTWDSPYFSLPTLEGREKRVDQIVFGGQVAEGNVQVTINPNQGGSAVTFAGTDTVFAQPVDASEAPFDLLQVRIKLNQGASTFKTPNGLPITIRGRARLSDPVEELDLSFI